MHPVHLDRVAQLPGLFFVAALAGCDARALFGQRDTDRGADTSAGDECGATAQLT